MELKAGDTVIITRILARANPFNGIERRVRKCERCGALIRIHSMELKDIDSVVRSSEEAYRLLNPFNGIEKF